MFEEGNVVKFKNGPQKMNLWGDQVELEYFLVKAVTDLNGSIDLYSHPYFFEGEDANDFELVAEDEFSEFPDDFTAGWDWWESLEDTDDFTGPNWIEFLGR